DVPENKQIIWVKQDLPFAEPIAVLKMPSNAKPASDAKAVETRDVPVFCVRGRVKVNGATVVAKFSDNTPGVTTHVVGKGRATCCLFLPSLSYYRPAVPKLPVDRGATDDAMIHFLPTDFDPSMARLIASPAASNSQPVTSSQPLVETTVIESKHGVVIPLVNWTMKPVKGLQVTVSIPTPKSKATLASGRPVKMEEKDGSRVYTFDLDVADALMLR
ncbi:MAG: hypothetical protein N2C14_10175, partial [Planctomycetales bacterium]